MKVISPQTTFKGSKIQTPSLVSPQRHKVRLLTLERPRVALLYRRPSNETF